MPAVAPSSPGNTLRWRDTACGHRLRHRDAAKALTVSGTGTDFVWYFENGTPISNQNTDTYTPTVNNAGTHTFFVAQKQSGCYSQKSEVKYLINNLPEKAIVLPEIGWDGRVCDGSTPTSKIEIQNPNANYTYHWYEGGISGVDKGTALSIVPNIAKYFVSVKDNTTGCEYTPTSLTYQVMEIQKPEKPTTRITLCGYGIQFWRFTKTQMTICRLDC